MSQHSQQWPNGEAWPNHQESNGQGWPNHQESNGQGWPNHQESNGQGWPNHQESHASQELNGNSSATELDSYQEATFFSLTQFGTTPQATERSPISPYNDSIRIPEFHQPHMHQSANVPSQPSYQSVHWVTGDVYGQTGKSYETLLNSIQSAVLALQQIQLSNSAELNTAHPGIVIERPKCGDETLIDTITPKSQDQTHHLSENRAENASLNTDKGPPAETPTAPQILACPTCKKKFHGKFCRGNLNRHQRSEHELHSREQVAKNTCHQCNKKFKRADAKIKHDRDKHGLEYKQRKTRGRRRS